MTHLTKDIDGTTYYGYAKISVLNKRVIKTLWDTDDSLDRSVTAYKGAPNERQLLKLPADSFEDVRFLDVHETVTGQDAYGNDISEYSIVNDTDLKDETLMAELRAERDRLLAECDWTQIPDTPLAPNIQQDWADYRQALRDLPANTPDPENPTWPTKP